MSPFQIRIVLHANTTRDRFPQEAAPIYRETVKALKADGLVDEDKDGLLSGTPRGAAYVHMICSTPFPVAGFVDPRTGVLVEGGRS